MSLRILGHRVHVRPVVRSDSTPAGLVIPPKFQSKQPFATVLALGSRVTARHLKVGDLVRLDTSYGAHDLPDGTRIVSLLDVQAIIGSTLPSEH